MKNIKSIILNKFFREKFRTYNESNNNLGSDRFKYELDLNEEDDEVSQGIINKNSKKVKENIDNILNEKNNNFEFDFGDVAKKKNKKNNFKIQNGWIYPSDFSNY